MDYNGGALISMKGKDCVAIATDKRFGIQAQTVSLDFTVCFLFYFFNIIAYHLYLIVLVFNYRKFFK